MSPAKKPADHKPKAAKRLQAEAANPELSALLTGGITVSGRGGTIEVTVIEDPMEWEAESIALLEKWQALGGARPGDVIPFVKGIISAEDGARVDAVRPTLASAIAIAEKLMGGSDDADDETDLLETVGESHAS